MKAKDPSLFSARHAARFRLARHYLLAEEGADVVSICAGICGAQAQLTNAAYLQLWTRNHSIRRTDVEAALWQKRSLVKTHLMRQTLHLVRSSDYSLYISALRSCRVADGLRIMRRFKIDEKEAHDLTPLILEALAKGALKRAAITAAVRPRVSRRVQAWMAKVWSIVRVPMAEGLVCYGPGEENDVTLIRTDSWLKKQQQHDEDKARAELLRRYLRAYGPATLGDFGHWAGLPAPQVKPLRAALGDEICEITIDGRACLLLREDLPVLSTALEEKSFPRLLPHFDPYLLAHREKDHLLPARYYKRVYRNQGWISPVVLVDGEIAAVWSYKTKGSKLQVNIEPFAELTRAVRAAIAEETEDLAGYFGLAAEVTFR